MISALLLLPMMLTMEAPTHPEKQEHPGWLLGQWSGKGELFGQPAKMLLSVCPLVGHRGLTLNYQVTGVFSSAMQFAGHADYVPDAENRWRGRWIGSNGVDHDLTAVASDQSFIANWHNAEVETGQTQYRSIGPGRLRVTDYVMREEGRFEQFASADYDRKTDCEETPDKSQ